MGVEAAIGDFMPLPRQSALLLLLIPTWVLSIPSAGRAQVQPNILLILVDDLGYGDLSSHGAPDLRTPNIDAIVDSGMRFDRFYANSPVCSPTRASLLTGRFPDRVGVPGVVRTDPSDSFGFFNPGAVTLADVLGEVGYHTAIIGKWHLGLASPSLPNDRGFDHFHGFLGDMMDDYYTHLRHGINYMRVNEQVIEPSGHATDLFTQWAVEFIDGQVPGNPFFLFLSYNAPHVPVQPPPEWLDRVRQREPGVGEQRAALVALIEHLDDGIGQVMSALDESGLAQNTLVVFTSDNGGQLDVGARNQPYRGGKQDMLEGGIRVAMAAAGPGRIEPGTQSDRTAMTLDLFPTFCEVAGTECNHEIDGRSLLATLLGFPQREEERFRFWVRRGDRGSNDAPYYAASHDDYKILQNTPAEAFALYDLLADPQEQQDLGSDNAVYQELSTALTTHVDLAAEVGWQPGAEAIVPRTISLLEPDGGESWEPGSRHDIVWSSDEAYADVRLDYTLDGYSWLTLADPVPATGIYSWTVPEVLSDSARIRVSALAGNVSDVSDAPFRIPEPTETLLRACALVALSLLRRRAPRGGSPA
jgi:arylsulfatase A-like enzyme